VLPAGDPLRCCPLFAGAIATLALVVLAGPVGAMVRWHFGQPSALAGREALADRLTRVAALAVLGFVLGWAWLFQKLGSGAAEFFSQRSDPVFRGLQTLGLIGGLGTLAALWNVVLARHREGSRLAALRSVVTLLAFVVFVWFGLTSGWLSQSLRY
jgi:fluoride ion exporter CrcB/FEX